MAEHKDRGRNLYCGHESYDDPIPNVHHTFAVVKTPYAVVKMAPVGLVDCGENGTRRITRSFVCNRWFESPAEPVANGPMAIEQVVSQLISTNLVVACSGCAAPLDAAETMIVYSTVGGRARMATESL